MENHMKIYTFDTRDLLIWDLLKDSYHLNGRQIFTEVQSVFNPMIKRLNQINVPYDKLKNVLIPQKDKFEICFIFDSQRIDVADYGTPILKSIIPLLANLEKTAVFFGDLIGPENSYGQIALRSIMEQSITFYRNLDYRHSSQYFIVYITNLTLKVIESIHTSLKENLFYIGYANLTYQCFLKDIVSVSINQKMLFYKKIVILPVTEDDTIDDCKPINYTMINFKDFGYSIRNIGQIPFSSFLSFKIARRYSESDVSDQIFALNTVIENPLPINKYELLIDPAKLQYLKDKKIGILKKSGIEQLDIDNFIKIIKYNINSNYLFNMDYNQNFECLKANTFIDICNANDGKLQKCMLSFQIDNKKKALRFITMY